MLRGTLSTYRNSPAKGDGSHTGRHMHMHTVPTFVRTHVAPRVAAGALVAFALLSAACSDSVAPSSASQFRANSSSLQALAGSDFAVLANAAVTCTGGTIAGDVGTFQAPPTGSVTLTSCPISGGVHVGDGAAVAAYRGFLADYAALAPAPSDDCTMLTGTLADVTLTPGMYCFDAAAALTGTLTLDGSAGSIWIFKIGTSGTGALTGTNFTVLLTGGAQPCNVTWWVAEAATMTTSNFVGNILAGAAITMTGGTFSGNAYAQADVTFERTTATGCQTGGSGHSDRDRCNQGVGNGPEACDPGNSNHRRPTNDEEGGIRGKPGRSGTI